MGAKMNGKSFSLMIDKLYTKKEDAVVRELGANARDAMHDLARLTGTAPGQWHIHLPSHMTHELIISDNGTGLSIENVKRYLGNLFESTKENENMSIGAYGLGSKSPFAVTDSYIIESRFEGQLHSFSFFRAKGSIPKLVHIGSKPTEEPNGITYKVPSSVGRYETYARSVAAQLFFFEPRPIVVGQNSADIWENYGDIKFEGTDWKYVHSQGLSRYYGQFLANMGGVSYPLDMNQLINIDLEDDYINTLKESGVYVEGLSGRIGEVIRQVEKFSPSAKDSVFALFFGIGDLEIPPSREALEYDAQTCYNILLRLEKLVEEFIPTLQNHVRAVTDDTSIQTLSASLLRVLNYCDWTNHGVNSEMIFAMKEVEWEMDMGCNLPPVINSKGLPVNGKLQLNASQPRRLTQDVKITFPHMEREVEETKHVAVDVSVETDTMDVVVNGITQVVTTNRSIEYTARGNDQIGAMVAAGWEPDFAALSGEPEQVRDWEQGGYMTAQRVLFKRNVKQYLPVLRATHSVVPSHGTVSPSYGSYTDLSQVPVNDQHFRHNDIVVYVDTDNEMSRRITWIMRNTLGEQRGIADVQDRLTLNPWELRCRVVLVRSDTEDGFAFYEAWSQSLEYKPKIIRLSTVTVPKAERDPLKVSVRGMRILEIEKRSMKYGMQSPANLNNNQRSSFSAIPASTDKVEPGFLLYNDGKSEKSYLDMELTREFPMSLNMGLLVTVASLAEENFNLYRITPMNFKNVDKYKDELNITPLSDFLDSVGYNQVGSRQFQRRYKAFTLANAYKDSPGTDIALRKKDYYTKVWSSKFLNFQESTNLPPSRINKHLKMALYSLKNGGALYHHDQYDIPPVIAFGYRYAQHYGVKLSLVEASRLAMDFAKRTTFAPGFEPSKPGRFYHNELYEHAKGNFKKFREQYIKEQYKAVLFGSFFDRDTLEFEAALEKAKSILMP
jgi:hypothetical protein